MQNFRLPQLPVMNDTKIKNIYRLTEDEHLGDLIPKILKYGEHTGELMDSLIS